ncbi:MAG: tRNA 2-thiouridine(34) synthase MnmA [Synergistaceae bacterium]
MKNIIIKSTKNSIWNEVKDKPKVLVMMSGGVDSTASALMLKRAGYNVAGFTMSIFDDKSIIKSAEDVCETLQIPHFYVEIGEEFKKYVSDPFCESYTLGETPNPCADCNEKIKFGLLLDLAEEKWGDKFYIATGHYARIEKNGTKARLARAKNLNKDQSYFMSGIKERYLERIIFPLNEVEDKEETRKYLREAKINIAEKTESMEICFANEDNYRKILNTPSKKGYILNSNGNVIGEHNGISNFTLGQRKGLGIAARKPLYVIAIKPCENSIIVAERKETFLSKVNAYRLNVLAEEKLTNDEQLYAKIRSQGEPVPCSVITLDDETDTISVEFDTPVFAPTPGQRLVIYSWDGIVVAGAVITK